MGSAPVGVQCPLTFSLGEFPDYLDWLWYTLGFRLCWCPSPFPSPSLSRCFPFTLLHLPLHFIRLSSLRLMYLDPSVNPSLTNFSMSFQAWDWLWYPMLWSQRRNNIPADNNALYCIAFIYFYRASHSISLSPTTAIGTVSEFTRRGATGKGKLRFCPRSLRGG